MHFIILRLAIAALQPNTCIAAFDGHSLAYMRIQVLTVHATFLNQSFTALVAARKAECIHI